jgi:hypothetical protein
MACVVSFILTLPLLLFQGVPEPYEHIMYQTGMSINYYQCQHVGDSTQMETECTHMCRVGQNHIYTVYIRYFWQGNHQIYGHIRCIYTVLANTTHVTSCLTVRHFVNGN